MESGRVFTLSGFSRWECLLLFVNENLHNKAKCDVYQEFCYIFLVSICPITQLSVSQAAGCLVARVVNRKFQIADQPNGL